jgi:hypothetical protein
MLMTSLAVRRLLLVEHRFNLVSVFSAFVKSNAAFSPTCWHNMYGGTVGGVSHEVILHHLDQPNTWR